MPKMRLRPGLCSGPPLSELTALLDSLAGFKEPTSKGRGRQGRAEAGRERKGWEEKGWGEGEERIILILLFLHFEPLAAFIHCVNNQNVPLIFSLSTGCLQLLEILEISWNLKSLLEIPEISWNFIDVPGKFNCQLNKYDNMPITEPNLVTSLNPRNCHLTTFCAVLFTLSYITESACVCIPCCNT